MPAKTWSFYVLSRLEGHLRFLFLAYKFMRLSMHAVIVRMQEFLIKGVLSLRERSVRHVHCVIKNPMAEISPSLQPRFADSDHITFRALPVERALHAAQCLQTSYTSRARASDSDVVLGVF